MNTTHGPFPNATGYHTAVELDNADALTRFRAEFVHDADEIIYLDGNSLGRLPQDTERHLADVVTAEWGRDLISSWGKRWWDLPRRLGDQIAPLIGAPQGSVVVADSTSVVLFKLAWSALISQQPRGRILTDDHNFPTDLYILRAAAEAAGGKQIDVIESGGDIDGPEERILDAIDSDTALVALSHVTFRSGFRYDIESVTSAAHDAGALVLWDLSHSVGVVPTDLRKVDLAVGCTYKYLNGGPGSPAFLYVHPDLDIRNPLTGWWGHQSPFSFDPEYEPATDITRFQTGTMPILSLTALEPALSVTNAAGIIPIRKKSVQLTSFLIDLADEVLSPLGFEVASPRDPVRRGSHVSLRHADAWRITQAMLADGAMVPDFREPHYIRLGLAPLYTRFIDVHTSVNRIAALVLSGAHTTYPQERSDVT